MELYRTAIFEASSAIAGKTNCVFFGFSGGIRWHLVRIIGFPVRIIGFPAKSCENNRFSGFWFSYRLQRKLKVW